MSTPSTTIEVPRPQPMSEVAKSYERRAAAKLVAGLGLGAAPTAPATGLGNLVIGGLAGIFGIRRAQS